MMMTMIPQTHMALRPRSARRSLFLDANPFDEDFFGMLTPHMLNAHEIERQAMIDLQRHFLCKRNHTTFDLDCKENEDGMLEISADLPGFAKEEVAIDLKNHILTISARKNEEKGMDHTMEVENKEEQEQEMNDDADSIEMLQDTIAQRQLKDNENAQEEQKEGQSMLDRLRATTAASESIFQETNTDTQEKISAETEAESKSVQGAQGNKSFIGQAESRKMATAKYRPHTWVQERSSFYGSRSIKLPSKCDESRISAVLEYGVLKITIPRVARDDSKKKKSICIR